MLTAPAVHEGQLDSRLVAVKKIHRLLLEAASGERETWERVVRDFEKECRVLEELKHPHIVGFSGAFYDVQSEEPVDPSDVVIAYYQAVAVWIPSVM